MNYNLKSLMTFLGERVLIEKAIKAKFSSTVNLRKLGDKVVRVGIHLGDWGGALRLLEALSDLNTQAYRKQIVMLREYIKTHKPC